MTTFAITITGDKVMEHKLRRMGTAAVRARPAMREVAALLLEIERTIFLGQGRRGGGSWAQDTEEWQRRKMRMGLDPRINIASRALMKSLSVPEAPYQVLHIGDRQIILGTELPYIEPTQKHRPVNKILPTDRLKIAAIIRSYLLSRFKV